MIDTLKLSTRLQDSGMPPEQARALTEELSQGLKEQAVSKTDLELALAKLETGIITKISLMMVVQLFAVYGVIKYIHG
ncbi:CCDC90 family protein [Caballeronia sp. TF1N1]|uniref:CCDC90 family protein n=1 Tax=Caballeronia sp. TF1N1 TaxID=2878153 RepID=UPI001FD2C04F|nr:CCDC90 family protein [Caballeronia sp. TF1N1]